MQIIKVLLVENKPGDARLIQKILSEDENINFEITHKKTFKEAINILKECNFDIVLLDLFLPDSQGLQTFIDLYETDIKTPIIVLSSFEDKGTGLKAVQKGAQDYLVKDIENEMFIRRSVRYAIERYKMLSKHKKQAEDLQTKEEELEITNQHLRSALKKIQQTQQEMIKQERLNALGRMASGIAHEFNNALSPILGFCELLLLNPSSFEHNAQTMRYLNLIKTSAEDATDIVSSLREFYKPEPRIGVTSLIDINKLIENVILFSKPKFKKEIKNKGIEINIKTNFELLKYVPGDEVKLNEAFTNLLFNAIESIEKNGEIEISTFNQENKAMITIKDDGTGMSPEHLKYCLEPFYSSKSHGEQGMGLAITYGIIRRHNGKLEIESKENEGTTVTIILPASEKFCEQEKSSFLKFDRKEFHHNVLVVEDDEVISEVITEYLNYKKYAYSVAYNGEDGLKLFKEKKFDLVITDKAMPKMDGENLAKAIKNINSKIPVVLLTGFGDLIQVRGEKTPEIDLVICKPINLQKINKILKCKIT